MPRLMVTLQLSEREALLRLARREKRDPRNQAALIIRRELERAGLLVPEKPDKLVHSDHQAAAV